MNSNSHDAWMNQKESEILLVVGPDKSGIQRALDMYFVLTGTDNTYENRDAWDLLYRQECHVIQLKDVSWLEAQQFAEPIRILHPEQCVTLSSGSSFIGNTSWKDQMEMFFGYPVYTPYGEKLKAERNQFAEANGIPMAWE